MKLYKNKWQIVRIAIFLLIVLGWYAYYYAHSHGWPSNYPPCIWWTKWGQDSEQTIIRRTYLSANETGSYIIGNFPGSDALFDDSKGGIPNNQRNRDLVLVKVNDIGDIDWARPCKGTYAMGCHVTPEGGVFTAVVDFDDNRNLLTRYNINGDCEWTESWSEPMRVAAIDCDQTGNLYVFGDGAGAHSDFDPTDRVVNDPTLIGEKNCWLAAVSSSGLLLWSVAWGPHSDNQNWEALADDLIVSKDNTIYLTGNYTGNVNPDPDREIPAHGYSAGEYLAKYDLNGILIAWMKGIGGARLALAPDGIIFMDYSCIFKKDFSGSILWFHNFPKYINACDFDVATDGKIFVTGYFRGSLDMYFGADVRKLHSVGEADGFLAVYSGDSSLLTVETWGESNTDDSGDSIAWINDRAIQVTGCSGSKFFLSEFSL